MKKSKNVLTSQKFKEFFSIYFLFEECPFNIKNLIIYIDK